MLPDPGALLGAGVAVVGAGPAGLAAALCLELAGLALVAGLIGTVAGYGIAAALLPDVAASLRGLYGARLPGSLSLGPAWWAAGLGMSLAGALDLAITAWLVAAFTPAYSADRQQLFTIEYVWDERARSGRFAVNNDGAPVPDDGDW